MRLLLNVLWLVCGGLWMSLGYLLAGLILCITIVGIPLAIASVRMANYALLPFGRRLVDEPGAGAMSGIGNVLWLVLAGWWLALGHLLTGIALCVTIIGIPLGVGHFKLIPVSLLPMGKQIVDADDPRTLPGR